MPIESDSRKILAELEKVLASAAFANADRSAKLLRFLVEETVSGRGGLKESVLAVKVLGRHAVSSARQAARAGVKAARVWNKTAPADLRAQMYAAYEARCFLYTLRLIVDARRRALVERDDWIN